MVRRLLNYGAHVVTLVRSHKVESQFFMDVFDSRTSVEWDHVADRRVIERIFHRHPIEFFFHTACGADVNRVLNEPLECLNSNSKCNTSRPDGLRCCHAKEMLHTLECGRP